MAPITLLKKGSLVARMGENQAQLDNMVPIDSIMSWFDVRIDNRTAADMSDRVVVLLSKTGSGKSTSIAPNLYLRFFNRYRSNIIITQPRQLTATEIPKDIAGIEDYHRPNGNGLTIELYRNLGYQTMEFVKKPTEEGILFCTTGILLLQYLKNMPEDQFCRRFRFVIIDEAHDRALDVDLILMVMKRLIKSRLNNGAPFFIVMSATLNVQRFCKYFNTRTVFEVSGQSKPIDVVYPSVDVGDIYAKVCEIMADIDHYEEEKPPPPSIQYVIVFVPSQAYISKMVAALLKMNEHTTKKILPIAITAQDVRGVTDNIRLVLETDRTKFPGSDSELAFRRVIVSTPVAETGLTLPSLRYCIGSALQLTNEFNARHGLHVMVTKPTTRGMSLQRKCRIGRKHPGVFFPLYTDETANSLIVDDAPKIESEDFTSHLLALIVSTNVSSLDRLPIWEMPTSPPDDSVRYSLERLFILGAIDERGQATELGKMMNKFHKLSIESVKMILSGLVFWAPLKELVA